MKLTKSKKINSSPVHLHLLQFFSVLQFLDSLLLLTESQQVSCKLLRVLNCSLINPLLRYLSSQVTLEDPSYLTAVLNIFKNKATHYQVNSDCEIWSGRVVISGHRGIEDGDVALVGEISESFGSYECFTRFEELWSGDRITKDTDFVFPVFFHDNDVLHDVVPLSPLINVLDRLKGKLFLNSW